ncbi:hypothetical protein QFZ35_001564 [Arthrobacter ulcerisalmonis]|uniref:hypothetical protein n=1 Tax=Arthrobacter sp. B1I2 TaxID=3042263 RepID=UPI002787C0DA|nr:MULTISPECIES: hypothetical protein [Arthrobacter]MDQ0663066.1 hypothetical protein [Arthrobacter ulcerisalmonis]MDQ0730969.1 hypothetical protein [Arthrobacter sp. B1I2]
MAFQPGGDERRPSAPPPRPGLSYSAPPPIPVSPPAPRTVRTARTLWFSSFAAGLAVLLGSFAARESNLQRLRGVVADMASGSDAESVGTAAEMVFWGSIGALLLVTLLEAAALAAVLGRRNWARWVLVPLLASHLPLLLLASAFLVPGGDAGSYVVMLWGAGLLLAVAGLVFLFLPSAGAWLQREHSPG